MCVRCLCGRVCKCVSVSVGACLKEVPLRARDSFYLSSYDGLSSVRCEAGAREHAPTSSEYPCSAEGEGGSAPTP